MQNHGCLKHLYHEGGFSPGDVVGGTDPCEKFVAPADRGRIRRDEGTDLRQKHYQGRLPQECGLSGHVGSGQDYDLLRLVVQKDIVRDKLFPCRHKGLYHRMSSSLYVNRMAVVHLRAAISVGNCKLGKPREHIQPRQDAAVALDCGDIVLNLRHEAGINLRFEHIDFFFSPENLLLVFLQFGCNVPFGIDESLLPYPV